MPKIIPFAFETLNGGFTITNPAEIELPKVGVVQLCGSSGVGKSTVLDLLMGLHPEFRQGILYTPADATKESLKSIWDHQGAHRSYLFQNPETQMIHLSPLREFVFPMENAKISLEQISKSLESLKDYGLERVYNDLHTGTIQNTALSHGEKQRLLLLSLLKTVEYREEGSHSIVFLDEPTAFLDPINRKKMYQLIGQIKRKSLIFVIDHLQEEIDPYVDLKIQFTSGKVVLLSLNLNLNSMSPHHGQSPSTDPLTSLPTITSPVESLVGNNISIKFKEHPSPIVENCNFQFKRGEITAIIGASGSGKSTLMKAIFGMIPFSQGALQLESIEGKALKNFSPKNLNQLMSVLFQNSESHFMFDTIGEELESLTDKILDDSLLKSFGLFGLEARSPFELSEGQKRRLALWIILNLKTPFIFFDEPTFGQDPSAILLITNVMIHLKKAHRGIVIISHDEKFYRSLCDRIYRLVDGQLIEESGHA